MRRRTRGRKESLIIKSEGKKGKKRYGIEGEGIMARGSVRRGEC